MNRSGASWREATAILGACPSLRELSLADCGISRLGEGDLVDEPLLLLEDGHCLRDQTLAFCAPAALEERALRVQVRHALGRRGHEEDEQHLGALVLIVDGRGGDARGERPLDVRHRVLDLVRSVVAWRDRAGPIDQN